LLVARTSPRKLIFRDYKQKKKGGTREKGGKVATTGNVREKGASTTASSMGPGKKKAGLPMSRFVPGGLGKKEETWTHITNSKGGLKKKGRGGRYRSTGLRGREGVFRLRGERGGRRGRSSSSRRSKKCRD